MVQRDGGWPSMTQSHSDKLLQSALALHRAGRLDEAVALYGRVRSAQPRNFDAVQLSGVIALQQNRPADAALLLSQACRINPQSAPAAMRLGIALGQLRRFPEAEEALRAAAALDPKAAE